MSERAVFDCMLYLQAAARPRLANACFAAARSGDVTLCISPDVAAEVHDVLNRPELRRKFTALTAERVAAFLTDVLSFTLPITEVPHVYSLERDQKDEKYIDLAVAAGARYLVTQDRDLLDLNTRWQIIPNAIPEPADCGPRGVPVLVT